MPLLLLDEWSGGIVGFVAGGIFPEHGVSAIGKCFTEFPEAGGELGVSGEIGPLAGIGVAVVEFLGAVCVADVAVGIALIGIFYNPG